MVKLYTMIKSAYFITITEFRRLLSVKQLMRWLYKYERVDIGQGGDVICEIHPPGTGKRLAQLEQGQDK